MLSCRCLAAEPCRQEGAALPDVKLELVAKGLRAPVGLVNAADGSKRLFVLEQAGIIRVLKDGKIEKEPFLDIRGRVKSGGELGLLGLAFHPKDPARYFVDYTSAEKGLHTVISEFGAGSEKVLLTIAQPYRNHNGGQLAFGPDGLLYIGMGDGGSGNDPHNHAQDPKSLLGKILTLDVGPSDKPNPPKVYALGLRNPWRFSFDPVTKRLYCADVGQDRYEEIDLIERGGNYGWRVMEGRHCNEEVDERGACDSSKYKAPIWEYGRDQGISVTGGFVYRGSAIPELCGAYVFGDYGSGTIWALRLDEAGQVKLHRQISDSGLNLSSFGQTRTASSHHLDAGQGSQATAAVSVGASAGPIISPTP